MWQIRYSATLIFAKSKPRQSCHPTNNEDHETTPKKPRIPTEVCPSAGLRQTAGCLGGNEPSVRLAIRTIAQTRLPTPLGVSQTLHAA